MDDTIRQRHGCVTSLLMLMLIANALAVAIYLFSTVGQLVINMATVPSVALLILLTSVAIANIAFVIELLKWKKRGFWGLVATSLLSLVINFTLGVSITQVLFGLTGVLLLFFTLQIGDSNKGWLLLD